MIKWDGFGKLLKQGLFILLISCFILLGSSFVNGLGAYQLVGLNESSSAVDSNYEITFLQGGGLKTSLLGYSKSVLGLSSDVLFWWFPNGLPYVYLKADYGNIAQGFFDRYYICDVIEDYTLTGCSLGGYLSSSLDSFTTEIFKNFFSEVKSSDVAYYSYNSRNYIGATYDYNYNYLTVCWSSDSMGKSICFNGGYCSDLGNSSCKFFGNSLGSLLNSRGYSGLNFGNIPYSEIGYAPGNVLYEGGSGNSLVVGTSSIVQNPTMSGDVVYYRCTNQVAKTYYQNLGYSAQLCFAGTNYTGTGDAGFIETEIPSGLSLYDLWDNWSNIYAGGITGDSMTLNSFFGYWRRQYSLLSDSYNPFVSCREVVGVTRCSQVVPTAIQIYFENVDYFGYKYDNRTILDYCSIVLNSSSLDNDYNGSNRSNVCSVINFINPENGSVNSSGVIVGSDWSGIFGTGVSGSSGTVVTYTDGKTFSNNYFNLLKDKFLIPDKNGGNSGVLPGYIIGFLVLLILFRFLSK